ncbi:MAG: glycosyltransferase [Kiritimatiellae bacterium]|nr:glycosyltransferase [Kiritimatiellia bacterium]
MRVVHIGSNTTGGAGLGMLGVHKALLEKGVDSRIITLRVNPGEKNDPRISVLAAEPDDSADAKLLQKMKSKYRGVPMSLPYSGIRLEDHPLVKDADIVHLHWVSGMVDMPTFFPKIDKPVVWTVRDENAMMGLYHFVRETPAAPTDEERALDARVGREKTAAINQCRDLTFVSLCEAMKNRIASSQIGTGRETVVIPNRIDTSVFKPGDRAKVREEFHLADDETVILFAAQFLGEKRKGLQELLDALGRLATADRAFTVLCVGHGAVTLPAPTGVKLVVAGPTADRERMAEFYSAADLFVTPSYSETFGKTTAEAIACGTPVVSFPNMGARDIVEDGVDGFLTAHFNPISLSRAIEKALATKFDRAVMVDRIKARYSQDVVADKHLVLYSHIMDKPASERRASAPAARRLSVPEKKDSPRLSIVTICYNNVEGLRETLRSTLDAQYSFGDFEQIVVDGGSTDGTAETLAEYAPRLSWYCSEPDKGIYDAMNKGAAHARGEYLLFLNSGDILLEDTLVEAMREPFKEDLVYSDILFLTGKKISKSIAPSMAEMTPGWFLFNSLPHQATFIRRDLHEKLGGYDATMKISAAPKFIFNALFYHHCSYRKLDCVFSRFDRSGISSQPQMLRPKLQEWMDFLSPYYGQRVAGIAMRWLTVSKAIDWDVYSYLRWRPSEFEPVKRHIKEYIARKLARETAEKAVKSACRLSIITINKDNKAGLAATLRSTLDQQKGFPPYEQIVVDGGSADGSRDVIAKYAKRLAWSCSEKDGGIYAAMNKGVSHARGEYLLFLNSGDVLKPNCLAEIFAKRFSEDIVYADMYVAAKGKGKETLSHQADVQELTPGWFLFNTLPHQAAFIRRALHNRLGGYDESMKVSAAPKFFFEAVVRQGCSVRKLDKPFSVYDTTGISAQAKWLPEKLKDWMAFWTPYYGERVANCAKQYMLMRAESSRLKAAAAADAKKISAYEKKARRLEREVAGLKASEAYRVGMFVTWPARKAWGGVKCRKENGLKYTVKHAIGKVLRLFGSKVKW